MEKRTELEIRFVPDDQDEVKHVAEELGQKLGDKAEVQLIEEKASDISGRSIGPEMIIPAISVVLTGTQTYFMLAAFLEKHKTKTMIITNPATGEEIQITEFDSLETVNKKTRKIFSTPGFWARLFNRKQ